jgi:uncharacterized protein YvpB
VGISWQKVSSFPEQGNSPNKGYSGNRAKNDSNFGNIPFYGILFYCHILLTN